MDVPVLVRELLRKRGVESEDAVAAFLNPDYAAHTHDPFLFAGMERAVERTLAAIGAGERIAIYADFDCDGIPGAALLLDLFRAIGYERVEAYLPHRDREGYGFHRAAIEELAGRGVTLIITVDVGTTALEAVRFARERGVDVIVTDHHELPEGALPEAHALLNPKIAPYPFPHLCGAAVAWKLAQALLREGRSRAFPGFTDIPEGWEKWLLDLVAIATVADMVPLTGENRALAHFGLLVLRKTRRPGLRALSEMARVRLAEITEDDIGFSFAPRINAASRMDEPMLALRLLTTRDEQEARSLAAQLEELNASRKGVVGRLVREAKRHARERFAPEERVVVLGNPAWKPALLGLAANSVMEERGGLVCLWGRDGLGRIKGSCRSDGTLSVVEVFRQSEAFEEFGGHHASGGFSLATERVHTLHETLARAALAMPPAAARAETAYDAELSLREMGPALLRELSRIAPFGLGNPKPVFRIARARVEDVRRFGKEKNHVELRLTGDGASARAFQFFKAPEDFSHPPRQGAYVDVRATLERDTYRRSVALRIADILPCV